MRRLSLLTIACAATALAGCAATYPTYVMAPRPQPPASSEAAYGPAGSATPRNTVAVEESDLSSVEQPRAPRRVASRATRSDAPRTTAEISPAEHSRYTAEWWKEQDRVDERTKRSLNICRGC